MSLRSIYRMKTKEDIHKFLSISGTTFANWVKTGLIPDYSSECGRYSDNDYEEIVSRISETGKLTSRANRFCNKQSRQEVNILQHNKSKPLLKNLLKIFEVHGLETSCNMFTLCLKALEQAGLISLQWKRNKNILPEIISQNQDFSAFLYDWLLLHNSTAVLDLYKALSDFKLPEDEIDFLGAVYESMRSLGEKSMFGAFFTPAHLVNDLKLPSSTCILDPCSGTGTILLSILSREHQPQKITLRDIDALSLRIAKVNFALFFSRTDVSINTECSDAISWICQKQFDYIITNPPWGAALNKTFLDDIIKKNQLWKKADSFAIILTQALKKLSSNGKLVFILPESFLYVDIHSPFRKQIFDLDARVQLSYFGNAFKGVQSKVIRLEIDKKMPKTVIVNNNGYKLCLSSKLLNKNNYRPPAVTNNLELNLLEKLLSVSHFTLKGRCTFGLGIVTGNNKLHLFSKKSKDGEIIFTGKDLDAFRFKKASNFINFDQKKLQQTAPEHLYRSPKICYRFISNKLIMAADFEGSLLLNSANFFIPPPDFDIKALAAFFNAPVCTFLFQRLFKSVKVLRNHIESLPIPKSYFNHEKELIKLYDRAASGIECTLELHKLSCEIFGIKVYEL